MLPRAGLCVRVSARIFPHSEHRKTTGDEAVDDGTQGVSELPQTYSTPSASAFQDAGTAIHPGYVEGQIQGGTSQGIGWAISEEYFMNDEGRMMNTSLLDYRMPTALDLPMIEAVIVEVPNPGHPFGVRGVGEANIVPTLAALANAVHNAMGVRMRELPMTPASVVKALADGVE